MTQLMAILNITNDSFFASSRVPKTEEAIAQGLRFVEEGADIIDIGGESSRPGALPISEQEEIEKVVPVIKGLRRHLSLPLSIDTCKPAVAKAAVEAGATLINDITGFTHPEMVVIAKEMGVNICVMHMQGMPQTMQINPVYSEGITAHLLAWFKDKIEALTRSGIDKERIILDPGIGFGKTVADNIEIIQNLPQFKSLGCRLLLGVSRKSFLSKILNKPPEALLSATIAMNVLAIASEVDVIRVHDVKEHREVIDAMRAYLSH